MVSAPAPLSAKNTKTKAKKSSGVKEEVDGDDQEEDEFKV